MPFNSLFNHPRFILSGGKWLKLVLNGSYGAFATPYFILYNNHVAGTITAEGRELTRKMDDDNQDYCQ